MTTRLCTHGSWSLSGRMKTRLLAECPCVSNCLYGHHQKHSTQDAWLPLARAALFPANAFFFSFFFLSFFILFFQRVGFGFAVQMYVCHKRGGFEQKRDSAISFAEGRAVYCAVEGMMKCEGYNDITHNTPHPSYTAPFSFI